MGLKVQRKPAVLIAIGQGRTVFYIITASPDGQEKKTLPKREKNCYTIYIDGPVAQLGERLHGMQEVASSILVGSTILNPAKAGFFMSSGALPRRRPRRKVDFFFRL